MLAMFVLICGVLASLAIGVLAAYGLCILLFRVLGSHARQAATRPVPAAAATQVQAAS